LGCAVRAAAGFAAVSFSGPAADTDFGLGPFFARLGLLLAGLFARLDVGCPVPGAVEEDVGWRTALSGCLGLKLAPRQRCSAPASTFSDRPCYFPDVFHLTHQAVRRLTPDLPAASSSFELKSSSRSSAIRHSSNRERNE
jgi:hypothetical protein